MKSLLFLFVIYIIGVKVENSKARYLLVSINQRNNVNVNSVATEGQKLINGGRMKTDSSKQSRFSQSSFTGPFPIKIQLKPEITKPTCKNEKLKAQGHFYVQKKEIRETEKHDVTFFATIGSNDDTSTAISKLNADVGGACDHVSTYPGSEGCGLAAYMMATCFQNDQVLGVNGKGHDLENDIKWSNEPRKAIALDKCLSMIYLRCFTDANTPAYACISYLRGGKLADYDIIFMKKPAKAVMNVWTLGETVEAPFKDNADEFIKQNGFTWFFCKCKGNSASEKKECLSMATDGKQFNQ